MKRTRLSLKTVITGMGDALVILGAYALAFLLRFYSFSEFFDWLPPAFLPAMIAGYLIGFHVFGLYDDPGPKDARDLFWLIAPAVAFGAVLALLIKYVFTLFPIGRGLWVLGNLLTIVGLFLWRRIAAVVLSRFSKPQRVFLSGSGPEVDLLRSEFERRPRDFRIVEGVFTDGPLASKDLESIIDSSAADLIVLANPASMPSAAALLQARIRGIEVVDLETAYPRMTGRLPLRLMKDEDWLSKAWGLLSSGRAPMARFKRFFDIVVSLVGLLAGSPFALLIAAAIRLDSRGHAFYRQARVGRNEREFRLLKFRSMVRGAENEEPVWASARDPRVTRFGRFLRRFHIDELPQLWNVLRGEMSVVGPRPERPEFVALLKKEIPFYSLRHVVKPGLTGWAQVNYRYAASLEDSREKLEYDLYYVSRMSLVLDLKIAARTLQALASPHPIPQPASQPPGDMVK